MSNGPTDDKLAIYTQHSEHFRGLNSQMWQIPIIAMTLTGGLWFGVSNVKDSPAFQMGLLFLAFAGNVALIVVLARLRYVMGAYMRWLEACQPTGKIDATGSKFWQKSFVVRTTFQFVLGLAAAVSLLLLIITGYNYFSAAIGRQAGRNVSAYYTDVETRLADDYYVVDYTKAHPALDQLVAAPAKQRILYIGTEVARDVPPIALMGHRVDVAMLAPLASDLPTSLTGAQPSQISTSIPELGALRRRTYDCIIVSGVWTHLSTKERQLLFNRLVSLARPEGKIYIAFRDGPDDARRHTYAATVREIARLIGSSGATLRELPVRTDLLGRANVRWRSVIVSTPPR